MNQDSKGLVMEMFNTKTAQLGVLVTAAGIAVGVFPVFMAQYTDMAAGDLVMFGLTLIFGRDMMQKLIVK